MDKNSGDVRKTVSIAHEVTCLGLKMGGPEQRAGGAAHQNNCRKNFGKYTLATGDAGAYRLGLLQRLYGPGTRRLLAQAGIQRGMHVADLGCGIGTVSSMLSELVGPEGSVVGLDFSGEQIEQARKRAGKGTNINFVQASATDTRLASSRFDLVYCRFLLLHLPAPEAALAEMRRLLRPGGILVCEDGDLTTAGSEPPSVFDEFARLWGQLGAARGLDYTLGRRLYHLVRAAGFATPEIEFNQPVAARGPVKRLLELSVAEAGPAIVEAGLMSAVELERTLLAMRHLSADESVLAIMPRMAQVWAQK